MVTVIVMSDAIKIISLNIERDQHYDTALPFLKSEKADIVCLQEILDRDVERFKKELEMDSVYISVAKADKGRNTEELAREGIETGTAIFTRLPILDSSIQYFYGTEDVVPSVTDPILPGRFDHSRGVFLHVKVSKGDASCTIGTTHFTWTPDGGASEAQRMDIKKLMEILDKYPEIVFCGDFNAPRGGEIWGIMASKYTDNIPPKYLVSMDPNLHLVKNIPLLVDGLFSTPEYKISEVRLVEGVSDHKAIVGLIQKHGF